MAISDNNLAYLKNIVASGKTTIPALVYAKLKDLGYVTKVEGESAGRGRTVVVATEAGKRAAA
jgi:hypothetical protein